MADNTLAEDKIEKEGWLFTYEVVDVLLEVLRLTKSNMEGEGLDFEGDLVKLYANVCKVIAKWKNAQKLILTLKMQCSH